MTEPIDRSIAAQFRDGKGPLAEIAAHLPALWLMMRNMRLTLAYSYAIALATIHLIELFI